MKKCDPLDKQLHKNCDFPFILLFEWLHHHSSCVVTLLIAIKNDASDLISNVQSTENRTHLDNTLSCSLFQ